MMEVTTGNKRLVDVPVHSCNSKQIKWNKMLQENDVIGNYVIILSLNIFPYHAACHVLFLRYRPLKCFPALLNPACPSYQIYQIFKCRVM